MGRGGIDAARRLYGKNYGLKPLRRVLPGSRCQQGTRGALQLRSETTLYRDVHTCGMESLRWWRAQAASLRMTSAKWLNTYKSQQAFVALWLHLHVPDSNCFFGLQR